jgi:hypothetical protein
MRAVAAAIASLGFACVLNADADTRLVVRIPDEVARSAAAKLAGDGEATGPILVLEGVEVGQGEGLTVTVLAPARDPSDAPIVLAVTGIVGRSQTAPVEPLTKMKLVVPLNDRAPAFIAGKTSVTLTLRLRNATRPPLRVERAYFSTAEQPD